MALIYDRGVIDGCYDKWIRLGWAGTSEPFEGFVDPELLIIETTHAGRYEERILKAMLTWIRNFHDLINVQRLLHFIDAADTAVLGAVINIAIQNGADPRLKTVLKYCKPNGLPEVLFKNGDEFGVYDKNQKEFARDEYLKWGLYCTMVDFYDDAMLDKKRVLKMNPLLAIRALIGPNIRSEILFALLNSARIHIKELSRQLGYAYSPVYKEIMSMASSGFISIEKFGRVNVLSLSKGFARYLSCLPV